MCEQTEVNYLSGDIVWVKLGPSWWPGEVIDETTLEPEIKNSFKKTPIAVVKFFKEEQFEFVRNLNHIYKYNCRRKHEFIKKGIDMHRAKHAFMDKFPDDVSYAELLTGGDPDIITSDEFAPEQKPDYARIFGTPSHKKSTKQVGMRGRSSIGASHYSGKLSLSPQRTTTHRRFTTNNDHEIRMLQQTTPPATNSNYKCHICGFTSSRLNVIVLHNRSHSNGTFVSPDKQKSSKGMRKGKKNKSFANTSSIDEDLELIRQGLTVTKDDTDSDSDPAITVETTNKTKSSVKRKKKTPKSSSSKKTKVNSICNNLLADWGDSDSAEDLEKTIDESKESSSTKDTSLEENADENKIKNADKSKDADGKTSCFDFQDEEDSTMLEKSPGRKIPRVIPQKRISQDTQDKLPDESTVEPVEKSTETKLDNETPSDESKPPESPTKPLEEPDLDAFQAILNETAVPQLPDILEIPAKRDQTKKSLDTDEETNKEKTNGVFLETAEKKPGEKPNPDEAMKSDAHLSPKKRYRTFQEFETFVNDQPSPDGASSVKKSDKTHSKTKTADKTVSKTADKALSKKVEKTPSKKPDKSPVKKGDKTHLKEVVVEEIPTKRDDAIETPAIKDDEKSTSIKNDDEQQPLKKSTTLEVSKLKSQLMHKLTETPIHEQPKREPRRRESRKRYSRRVERSPTPEDEPTPIEEPIQVTSTTKTTDVTEAKIITESISMDEESKQEDTSESIKEPVVDDDKVIETNKMVVDEQPEQPMEETEETNDKLTKNVDDSGVEIPETTQTFPNSKSQEKTTVPPVLKIEENAIIQSQVETTIEKTQPPIVDEEEIEVIQSVEQRTFEKIEDLPLTDPKIESSDQNDETVAEIAKDEIKTENELVEDEKKVDLEDPKDSISTQIEEEKTESINMEKEFSIPEISEQETVTSEETVSTQELIPTEEIISTAEPINTSDLLNTEVINTEETISTTETIDSEILVSTTEVTENTEVTTTKLDDSEIPSQSEDSLKIEETFTEIVQEPIVTSEEVIQEPISVEETTTTIEDTTDETRSQKLLVDITDICIDNTDNLSGLSTLAAVSELTGSFYEKTELPAQEPTVLDVKELLQSEKPIELPLPRDKSEEIIKEKPKATLSTFSMDFSDSNSESTIIKPEILEAELKKEKKKATATFDSIESELEKMVSLGGSGGEKLNNFPTIPPPSEPSIIYPEFTLSETAVETSEFLPKKSEKKSTPIPPAAPSPSVSSLESEIAKLTDTNPDQESILHEHHQNTSSSKLLEILTDSKSKKSDHIIRPHRTYMPASSSTKMHMVLNESPPTPKAISKKYDPKTKYVIKSCTTTSKSGNKMNKPIILSEKIIKPMTETENVSVKKVTSKRSFQDVEDIDTFIISKPLKKQNHGDQLDQKDFVLTPKIEVIRNKGGVMRPRGKPKIIEQTIIKQADVVIPATDPPPLLDDSMFDINSMPIVLSDQILTPESIENMPVVLTDYVPQPQPTPPVVQPEIQPTPTLKRGGAIQHVKLLNKAKVSQPEITPKPVQTVVKNIMPRGFNKNQKIYQASSTKMLKNNPAVITQPGKPGKFIILPSSTTSSSGVSKYTVGKRVSAVKNAPAIANPTTSKYKPPSVSEPTGNKIMIVTNNQGVQSRVLLTPAQQKMLGKMPSTKITKSPSQPKGTTTLQKSILTSKGTIIAPATQKLPSLASQTIMTSKGQLITTAGQTLVTSEGQVLTPITQQQLKTLKSEQHKFGKKIQSRVLLSDKIAELTPQKPKMNIMSKTKTILIKGSQGQTLKKIQSPMSSMTEKNIVIQQQSGGHKSNQMLSMGVQSQTVGGKQILVNPKGQIINKPDGKTVQKQISEKLHRLSSKQSSTPTRILSKSSKTQMLSHTPTSSNKQLGSVNIPPLAPITSPTAKKETVLHPKKIAPALLQEKEKLPETVTMSDKTGETKQPNQLIIQDTLGNQTTVTEGQILALPSGETVDGQPQSYMLVTVDESGNLIPISNDALMSLDPTGTNEMSNIVLQFDTPPDTQPQETTKIETAPVEQQFAPVPAQTVEQQIIMDNQIVIPEQTIMTTTTEQIQESFLTQPQETQVITTDPSSFVTENQTAVACNISSGETSQQLIITGDPESTQKFLASLTDGNTDLSSLLSGTDGNIIINADGQQILLNTSTDNSILLSVNPDNLGLIQASTESDVVAQSTMYTTQQQVMKNQDILAAALADTDVFQPDVTTDKLITSQSKNPASQLSPNSSLYPMSVGNVLETSLTLSSPIMTPLELPSVGAKKINPNVESTLMSQVSSSLELPITITDPNISQTVSQQVMLGAELQTSLELPISMSESVITSIHTSEMSSPSFVYSLPSLDETADLEQKHVFPDTSSTVITTDTLYNTALTGSMSMPLLTEEPEISHEEPEMPTAVTQISEVQSSEISHEQTQITNIELDAQVQSDIHHEIPPVETEVSHMETEISQVEIEMPHMDTEETIVNTETFITNESIVTTSASETVISTEPNNIQQVETTEISHIESEPPSSHIETEVRQVEIEPSAHIEEETTQIETKPSHTETELQHIETESSSHIETELQQLETQSSHIEAELQHIETQSSHIDTEHIEIETSSSLHIETEQTHIEIESSHIQTESTPIEIASSHPETETLELEQISHDETKLSHVETEVPHAEIESTYVETTDSSHVHTEEVVPHVETESAYVETEHSHTDAELLEVETTKPLQFDEEIIQSETEPLQFETEITSSHTEIETTQIEHDEKQLSSIETDVVSHVETESTHIQPETTHLETEIQHEITEELQEECGTVDSGLTHEETEIIAESQEEVEHDEVVSQIELEIPQQVTEMAEEASVTISQDYISEDIPITCSSETVITESIVTESADQLSNNYLDITESDEMKADTKSDGIHFHQFGLNTGDVCNSLSEPPPGLYGGVSFLNVLDDDVANIPLPEETVPQLSRAKKLKLSDDFIVEHHSSNIEMDLSSPRYIDDENSSEIPIQPEIVTNLSETSFGEFNSQEKRKQDDGSGDQDQEVKRRKISSD